MLRKCVAVGSSLAGLYTQNNAYQWFSVTLKHQERLKRGGPVNGFRAKKILIRLKKVLKKAYSGN
jgi:hypothetical protein